MNNIYNFKMPDICFNKQRRWLQNYFLKVTPLPSIIVLVSPKVTEQQTQIGLDQNAATLILCVVN